ncbi:MAG: hypothetical protein ABIP74_04265 [Candidatus Saccharimonas sp.]
MPGPLKPDEVAAHKQAVIIPEKVFDAFNELIAKYWNGYSATFTQDEVMKLVLKKFARSTTVTRRTAYDNRWLDVEPIYREAGWKVAYDRPAYDESYEPTFTFSKP